MKYKRSPFKVFVALVILVGIGMLLLFSSRRLTPQIGIVLGYIGNDAGYSGNTYLIPPNQAETEPDLSGSLIGSLVDSSDHPISGIEVELMPLNKTDDQRSYATQREWTDALGTYRFPRVDPGEYLLAVQKSGAPDGSHPFMGTFYPGVDEERRADHIYIQTGTPLELHPLRLQRIDTVTLKVTVAFEDGTRPGWSNLLFHNPSFPGQAVIGNEAPGVEDGDGEFVVPVGFEYYARAKVDCNAGGRIETRESRPIQKLQIRNGSIPSELKFVIPGPPCTLWSPK